MKSYKIMQWLIPTALLVGFIVVMFLLFTAKVEQKGQDIVEDKIALATEEYALNVDGEMLRIEGSVELTVDVYEKYGTIHNLKKALMQGICDNTSAYVAVTVDEVGDGLSSAGQLVSLGGLPYFYHTKNGDHWFFTEDDGLSGKAALVYTSATNDGKYILAYYNVKDIFKVLKIEDYSTSSFFMVVDKEYDILASQGENEAYLSDDNILDTIKRNASNENKQAIKNMGIDFKNKQRGSEVVTIDGDMRSLCYAPINAGNFYLVAAVENSYVISHGSSYYEEAISMLFGMILAIAVFFLLVIIINLIMKIVDKKQKSELQIKADTDLLTGLTNKAATERLIKEYMEKNPESIGVLFIIDVDNFKKINDTMGHAFGDEVLKELGGELRGMFRAMDVVGRFGGDEFIVYMNDVKDPSIISRSADRLREFFRNFKAGEYVKYSVTASIGAAVFSEDGSDFEALFREADKALYVVKRRGKNDLAFYNDVKDEAESQLIDYRGREE